MERRDAAGGSGEPGSASPAPGLPSPPPPLQAAAPPHRTTNFFIDDILRPDFGRRKDGGGPAAGGGPSAAAGGGQDSDSSSDSSASEQGGGGGGPAGAGLKAEERTGAAAEDGGAPLVVLSGPGASPPQKQPMLWPAWVYCTRYSDRPSSGPRTRKIKKSKSGREDKRPRTAFTAEQLQRLKTEFTVNRYITEQRRQALAQELGLNESQIKIWFQNKRAKIKKASGFKNGLALQLMAQGLYNHSTTTVQDDRDSD